MVGPDDERSLQRRPDLNLQQLQKGGLIVGAEPGISGSLVSMTGAVLERITRERVGTPPELRLPERPVYLLDPNSRRLILITNREPEDTPKGGLFAEVVQLDEEGKPHYYLDSSDVMLPDETFQTVAVGPNKFNLPPSHIDIMDVGAEGVKRIMPWNVYLNQLENWMHQIRVEPGDDYQLFMQKFLDLKREGRVRVSDNIRSVFPNSYQSIDDLMVPFNFIIAEGEVAVSLSRASTQAGFFPFVMSPEELATSLEKSMSDEVGMPERFAYHLQVLLPLLNESKRRDLEVSRGISNLIRDAIRRGENIEVQSKYSVAVVTADERALDNLQLAKLDEARQLRDDDMRIKYRRLMYAIENIIQHNPIFSTLTIPYYRPELQPEDVEKQAHGRFYFPPDNEDIYKKLLNKVKADFFLSMFLRGGAPIVK